MALRLLSFDHDGFSFEVVDAFHYDELRPEYAPEAVVWVAERVGIGRGASVVDLAAGTGRLSGRFLQLGVDVIAVEPAANMRAVLRNGSRRSERSWRRRSRCRSTTGRSMRSWWATRSTTSTATRRWRRSIGSFVPEVASPLFWAWPNEEEQLAIPGMREIYEASKRTGRIVIAAAHRSGRSCRPPWTVRSVRAPGVPHDPRPAGGAPRRSLRDLERHRVDAGSDASPAARPHQASCRANSPRPCTSRRGPWSISAFEAERRASDDARDRIRERVRGIEPPFQAWEARVLPLNHTRVAPPGAAKPQSRRALAGIQPRPTC